MIGAAPVGAKQVGIAIAIDVENPHVVRSGIGDGSFRPFFPQAIVQIHLDPEGSSALVHRGGRNIKVAVPVACQSDKMASRLDVLGDYVLGPAIAGIPGGLEP